MPLFVVKGFQLAQWADQQSGVVQLLLFALFMMVVGTMVALEFILRYYRTIALGGGVTMLLWRKQLRARQGHPSKAFS